MAGQDYHLVLLTKCMDFYRPTGYKIKVTDSDRTVSRSWILTTSSSSLQLDLSKMIVDTTRSNNISVKHDFIRTYNEHICK